MIISYWTNLFWYLIGFILIFNKIYFLCLYNLYNNLKFPVLLKKKVVFHWILSRQRRCRFVCISPFSYFFPSVKSININSFKYISMLLWYKNRLYIKCIIYHDELNYLRYSCTTIGPNLDKCLIRPPTFEFWKVSLYNETNISIRHTFTLGTRQSSNSSRIKLSRGCRQESNTINIYVYKMKTGDSETILSHSQRRFYTRKSLFQITLFIT